MTQAISGTRLYQIFAGMKQRCYNPDKSHYKWYGENGITVCEEWMRNNCLQSFIELALSSGYDEDLTIDRIDSSKRYAPVWVKKSK